MPAHTRLWRSQEGIATLSYPPEPTLRLNEPADTMAGEDDLNSENPVSTEPFFDQVFMFVAIAVIGVCVLVLAIVVLRRLAIAAKKKARRLTIAVKGDATKSGDDLDCKPSPGQSTATLVNAVVVALPSPEHGSDEKFRPLCSEKTLNTLSHGLSYKGGYQASATRTTNQDLERL
ncbi:hypothetical protein AURDEDRAFT_160179 [Auricularia subglabra TFB-10046 SS5]|nr:hypothetical protein AURDEDRAFT_160179 [Auricularia subglabra TFB-10046 SS5]